MQFTELTNVSPEIIRATQAMGFTDMTEIQEKAIPLMLAGHDMIAKAPTGTGKTVAFGIVEPRIAVLALNPHAGDGGLLGSEEEHIIRPAVNEAYEKGILAFGPFAADGFFASGHYRDYDAVLAMYHDQGLTPFKTLSPDGVNFTACLGSVRTSPDHGVAFDIAGQDKADPQSMRNAIYLATDIVNNRRAWAEWTSNPLPHAERERGGRDLSVKDLPDTEKES